MSIAHDQTIGRALQRPLTASAFHRSRAGCLNLARGPARRPRSR